MPDTTTPILGLTKPEKRTKGWGTKWDGNADLIEVFLATTLASGLDPNDIGGGTKIGGYQNMLLTDADGVVWICTETDLVAPYTNVVWVRLGELTINEAVAQQNTWTQGQIFTWRSVIPGGSPVGVDALKSDGAIHFTMASDVEIRMPSSPAYDLNDAQQILFLARQDAVTQFSLTSEANVVWPGGGSPPSPPISGRGLYILTRIPGLTDIWFGAYNLGY